VKTKVAKRLLGNTEKTPDEVVVQGLRIKSYPVFSRLRPRIDSVHLPQENSSA
jgi:hypothetical protein